MVINKENYKKNLFIKYKELWNNCKTNSERRMVRHNFFKEDGGEVLLSNIWEEIVRDFRVKLLKRLDITSVKLFTN